MKYIIIAFIMSFMVSDVASQQLVEYSFRVEGACGMCQQRIEKNALGEGKASSAHWDVETKILTVEIDEEKTSVSAVKWFLSQTGHDNGDYLAPDKIYDDLHSCCKYREGDIPESSHQEVIDDSNPSEHGYVRTAEGYIYGLENGKKIPLIGANIIFEGANEGVTTDLDGHFTLDNNGHHQAVRISYIGYNDEVIQLEDSYIEVILADGHELDVVEITYKKRTTEISFVNSINIETITREELCKAACCNLSESFETNPSVDVSFNDAITGTKQIQMLGLAGPYVQITRELVPDVRTLNTIYGLNTTPGPWIESIQLIKGTGSVTNGFESITGQINVELKKPEKGERLHVNGFANAGGRLELNTNFRHELNDKISTGLLFHGKANNNVHDRNDDGFTDMPLEEDFVIANRWKYEGENLSSQFGIKYANLNHKGGSHDHFAEISEEHEAHWRMQSNTDRYEIWGKTGYIFPNKPYMSIGLQMSAVQHDQTSNYGNSTYNADQKSLYSNLIFQNIFKNGHILRTGLSYQLDDVFEFVAKSQVWERYESVPGAYVEYAIKKDEKWSIIPGLRIDKHSNYGTFITPRVHAKYNLGDKSIVRFTGGRGLKTANIFAENLGLFAGSRAVRIENNEQADTPYNLEAEIAWNYGVNYTQGLVLNDKELVLSLDAYRTSFQNQIVVDYENPRLVSFYNLKGESYSNSYQVKLEYEIFEDFNIRTAYRYVDAKTTFGEDLLERPMVSKHRAFINLAYKTDSDWHFDATLNWIGSMRLPDTSANPVEHQRRPYSPSYFLLNGQISKRWGEKYDVYIGVENLLNYRQTDAIIAGDDPFGQYFDASLVWAPLFGTNVYVGFRYNLPYKKDTK